MSTMRTLICLSSLLASISLLEAQTTSKSARGEVIAAGDRPRNVLFLIADDHAPYVTGCYGNKDVRTPNLDRLAASGMRFDRAYCNSPVCTASRASFITGMYPRSVGVTKLRSLLPHSAVTLAEMMKAEGYETAMIGKTHFNSKLTHGFDLLLENREWNRWLKDRGRKPIPEGIEVLPQWKPRGDPARIWLNSMGAPYNLHDEEMWGTWFARRGAEFLEQSHDRPFLLVVSLKEPHSPFRFPIEYRGKYDPKKMPLHRVGPEDGPQIPANFRDLTDAEKRGITASYYTSTEFMDKNMGIVLDALDASGHRDDTLVIYIGDHGYMLGQHGRIEKHCSYEPAVRSPLLMSYPDLIDADSSSTAQVEFIDIVPTNLDLCGIEIPRNLQGLSLRSVLTGETKKHRRHVFIEYAQNDELMMRDKRWKLIYLRGKRERTDGYRTGLPLTGPSLRLFDTRTDPGEFTNLAGRPEHRARVNRMLGQLSAWAKRTSRQPNDIPDTKDPMIILDHCAQPHDVSAEEALAGSER